MTEGPWTPAVSDVPMSEMQVDTTTSSGEPQLEPTTRVDGALETSTGPAVVPQIPDVIRYEYEPLLQRLDADCRRIVAMAHSEAETIRNEAREESHRRMSSAHCEEAKILSRCRDQQAVIYRDTQHEVDRRLEELQQEGELGARGGPR